MSKEDHPNIHAVQVTTDLILSIKNNLRGKAGEHKKEIMSKIDNMIIVDFMADLSTEIDRLCNRWCEER